MAKEERRIHVDNARCMACRACEIACALRHSESGELARAITERPLAHSCVVVRSSKGKNSPVQCMQCARPKCVEVCAPGALWKDGKTTLVALDQSQCTGCGLCVEACPFDAIFLDEERGIAYKCDLCEGRPACVPACPTEARFFGTREEFRSREKVGAES
jgi:carbon-monoxide dehydrogenase iron sulfur subunit